MNFIAEFKKFALRGSLVDMAVGFTVGAAFSTIAKSLVDNIIMPPVGLLIGKADFSDFYILLKAGAKVAPPYATLEKAQAAGAVTINYGLFVNSILAFLLVAIAMFVLIRVINKVDKGLEQSFLRPATASGEDPENKKCPYCVSTVPFKAVRCPACTSDLADHEKALNNSIIGQEVVAKAQAALSEPPTDMSPKQQKEAANQLSPEVIVAKASGESPVQKSA